ncbi:MAG: hypothetical protein DRN17_04840, partial [Thermoplasmata archaeon]
AKTFFADGALELFINKLNILFNPSNFNEEHGEYDSHLIASVDRASGYGIRKSNGQSAMMMNLSGRRHAIFFAPSRIPVGYFSFNHDGSTTGEEIYNEVISSAPVTTITNESKVDEYQEKYGLDMTEVSVDIVEYDFMKSVFFCIAPEEDVSTVYIFVKIDNRGIVPIMMNLITKIGTILDPSTISTIASANTRFGIDIEGDTLKFAFDAEISECDTLGDLSIQVGDIGFYVDSENNTSFGKDGNIRAISYVSNLLNKSFV